MRKEFYFVGDSSNIDEEKLKQLLGDALEEEDEVEEFEDELVENGISLFISGEDIDRIDSIEIKFKETK